MYLFLPGPGLHCHTQEFSIGLRRVRLACVVRGPLSAASPVAVWALGCTRFIRGALWAPQLWAEGLAATWHVGSSQTGIGLTSPALAGGCSTAGAPGKP